MSDPPRSNQAANRINPAHPHRRQQPLPWHRPKPAKEDPEAPRRVQAILESPSYREADQDTAFLNTDEARSVRLQLDYLKAEQLLEQHRVKHTIVVLGSTRIPEPTVARQHVEALRHELQRTPSDDHLRKGLAIAERVAAKTQYYEVAREFGRLVGGVSHTAHNGHLSIVTGGGPGIMEAANRGAFDVGAKSIGLNITLPHEQFPNPYITPDLCFRFHYFAIRKMHFLLRACAVVAFPGGYGTFDELFEVLTLIQTRKILPLPVVLVGERYWKRAVDVDFLADEGTIDLEDRALFWYAESAQEIWDLILAWHQANGTPLFRTD